MLLRTLKRAPLYVEKSVRRTQRRNHQFSVFAITALLHSLFFTFVIIISLLAPYSAFSYSHDFLNPLLEPSITTYDSTHFRWNTAVSYSSDLKTALREVENLLSDHLGNGLSIRV